MSKKKQLCGEETPKARESKNKKNENPKEKSERGLTGANVGDELIDGLGSEELAEDHGPVGLDLDTGTLDEGLHLVGGHLLAIVGEDESGVGASEVSRHLSVERKDGEKRMVECVSETT